MVGGWMAPLGRAPGLETQAGINPRRSLQWGYGGVNICPMTVTASKLDIEDPDYGKK